MRKRDIIALSALTVASIACTSDDSIESSRQSEPIPISIDTYLGTTTRGVVVNPTIIHNPLSTGTDAEKHAAQELIMPFHNSGFKLYANSRQSANDRTEPLMTGQDIVWKDNGSSIKHGSSLTTCTANINGQWTYSPIKYWPVGENATVDFYPVWQGLSTAVDPESSDSENIIITPDWNNVPQVTFYVNDIVSKQSDFLWAPPTLNASYNSLSDGKIHCNFQHALCAFQFGIKLGGDFDNDVSYVTVNSVTLSGYFAPKGHVNPKATSLDEIWDLEGDWQKRSYTISAEGNKELWAVKYTKLGYFSSVTMGGIHNTHYSGTNQRPFQRGTIMVLPFKKTSYSITLSYNVTTYPTATDKNNNTNGVTRTYIATKEVTNATLNPGEINSVRITLNLNKISVDSDISQWTSEYENITIPEP